MSDVVKKDKTVTIDRYLVAVSYDNSYRESFALEGVDTIDNAVDRFLNFYLVFRSKQFPTLRREDIESVKETSIKLDLPEGSPALAEYKVEIPEKSGEDTLQKTLTITFSRFQWGMLL